MKFETISKQLAAVFLTPHPTVTIINNADSGCRQVVRQQLPKLPFVGSNPITRSFFYLILRGILQRINVFLHKMLVLWKRKLHL